MDQKGGELIFMIIKVYYIKNASSESASALHIPYEGVCEDENVTFDLEKMPKDLKRMLLKFAKMNGKKMAEDQDKVVHIGKNIVS